MKKSTMIVIGVAIVALVGLGIGMRMIMNYFTQKAGDKVASSILSTATGGKVNVDSSNGNSSVTVKGADGSSVSYGSSSSLPSGFPSDVPAPSFGKISGNYSSTDTNGASYSIAYTLTAPEVASANDTYQNQLKAKGFTISDTSNTTSNGSTFTTFTAKNATHNVSVIITGGASDTDNAMTLVVTNAVAN